MAQICFYSQHTPPTWNIVPGSQAKESVVGHSEVWLQLRLSCWEPVFITLWQMRGGGGGHVGKVGHVVLNHQQPVNSLFIEINSID